MLAIKHHSTLQQTLFDSKSPEIVWISRTMLKNNVTSLHLPGQSDAFIATNKEVKRQCNKYWHGHGIWLHTHVHTKLYMLPSFYKTISNAQYTTIRWKFCKQMQTCTPTIAGYHQYSISGRFQCNFSAFYNASTTPVNPPTPPIALI